MIAMSFLSAFRKDAPAVGDVHVSTSLGGKRPKAKPFKAIIGTISPNAKLPVTGATLAAQQEDPDDGSSPTNKRGARNNRADRATIQAIHDHACQLGAACGNGDDDINGAVDDTASDDAIDQIGEWLGKRAPEWSIPFTVAKVDADQQLIFGWASVVEKGGKIIIDKQEDGIEPEVLEKAVYDFMLNSRSHGNMHKVSDTGRCIESVILTKEKQDAMGIDLGKVAWWIGVKVDDPETWAAHKRGELLEFSIGGTGRRETIG
jgi:hypothetical protein